MPFTKIVQCGDSQTVRIPAELAYDKTDVELEIERIGAEIRIRPAQRSLAEVPNVLARFSPDFMSGGRGGQEQAKRAATDDPALVTVRGRPAYVLLSIRKNLNLQSEQDSDENSETTL